MLPGPALVETLDRKFGSVWLSHNGMQINVACPFCPGRGKGTDSSGHMGLNFEKNGYHCVRCDAGGKLKTFLDRNHIDNNLRLGSIKEVLNLSKMVKRLVGEQMASYVPPTMSMEQFPKVRYITDEDYQIGTVFANSLRGKDISLEEARRHFLCACEDGREAGYVIFPFFESSDEQPVYWQGRDATGEARLRKLNPSNKDCPQGKAHWLYNFESAQRGGAVYIVEGTLDAISLQTWLAKNRGDGHCAVSVQGTTLSFPTSDAHPLNTQYGKLVSLRPENVYVVFDGDAWVKSLELANVLSTCGLNATPIRLVGGDPNELKDKVADFMVSSRPPPAAAMKRLILNLKY